MCQIIAVAGHEKINNVNQFLTNDSNVARFKQILQTKGDSKLPVNVVLTIDSATYHLEFDPNNPALWQEKIHDIITYDLWPFAENNSGIDFRVLFFARMAPEMEQQTLSMPQPYYNPYNKSYYAVHGTITNDKEIGQKYGISTQVDTDIFAMIPGDNIINEIVGNFVVCEMPNKYSENKAAAFYFANSSGLGIWQIDLTKFTGIDSLSTKMLAMSRYQQTDTFLPFYKLAVTYQGEIAIMQPRKYSFFNREAIALYSGGLDITASVVKYKKSNLEVRITGLYFDWGSRAAEHEIKTGYKAKDAGIIDDFKVLNIKEIFGNIQSVILDNDTIRLADPQAEGVEAETEQAVSYVPYRNTLFMTLAATWAEKHVGPDKNIDIIIGANLSEAMGGYGDNTNGYLDAIGSALSLGGKIAHRINVVSPYAEKTKTEMLKDIAELGKMDLVLENSFSCYFPNEDGTPCGKCGSCILRQRARERAQKGTLDGNVQT